MIIDVHGHITPPELLKRYPMPPSLGDIDGMIEQKLLAGVDLTIVGSPVGFGTMMRIAGLDNYAQTLEQLQWFHNWLTETVAKHHGHLKAYAYANPFGDDKQLQQTMQTVKDGGFVGLIVNTSVNGEYLDSERADDFFAMASELDVPILLHPPAEPVGSDNLRDFRLVEQVGRFCDVTVGIAALVFGGRMEQYPNLNFIGATAGGAIALLPSRLDMAYQPRHWQGRPGQAPPSPDRPGTGGPSGPPGMIMQYENRITHPPSEYLKRIYVDTTSYSEPAMLANLRLVGAEHILFGTDSPPLGAPLADSIGLIMGLPITDDEKQLILGGNAQRLFKLSE